MGSGVAVGDIERIYDKFIQQQITTENQKSGYWNGMANYLEQVEIVFNEASGFGISQAMEDFWNSWNDVANNPSGYVERVSLISSSQTLAMTFNQGHESLTQLQDYITSDIAANIENVNLKAGQIQDLNQQILQRETAGSRANDLRDQRDLLVNELAGLINVNVSEDANGNINIFTGSGQPLVSGVDAWQLDTVLDPVSPTQDHIVWVGKDGATVDITDNITNGKIKGMLDVRDDLIPDYLNRLNTLAENIITGVNHLHATGEDLNGNAGGNFFDPADADHPAKTMSLAIEDTDDIAAADFVNENAPGGNSVAIAIAELQNDMTMGASATFSDFYRSLVSDVGNAVQYAKNNQSNQTAMVNQLTEYRESISGVSLDEEMVNLVKFQHAYAAAAKLISTVDEMLDSLLSIA
jgi:flagellar hook-associated protein 1 FlgK